MTTVDRTSLSRSNGLASPARTAIPGAQRIAADRSGTALQLPIATERLRRNKRSIKPMFDGIDLIGLSQPRGPYIAGERHA
jgi:hypothetical protein